MYLLTVTMCGHLWLFVIYSVLAFVSPFCFYGGTDSCQFQCHCRDDEACIAEGENSGSCPESCGHTGSFKWSGLGCQTGNVALFKTARQTGKGVRTADYAVDGITSGTILDEAGCSLPEQDRHGLWWEVDLGDVYVISAIHLYPGQYVHILSGLEIFVQLEDLSFLLCGITGSSSGDIKFIYCPPGTKGLRVKIMFDLEHLILDQMFFCEVSVQGYEYIECEVHNNEYRYGPACLQICHCQTQCDYITGECPRLCTDGYRKDNDEVCSENCSGYFGETCDILCNCKSPCEVSSGICNTECKDGFKGTDCQEVICDASHWGDHCIGIQPCNAGYWGIHCENICKCADINEVCSQTTGICSSGCHSSYIGKTCGIKIYLQTDCSQNDNTNSTCRQWCLYDDNHIQTEVCDLCFRCTNEPILPVDPTMMSIDRVTNTSVVLKLEDDDTTKNIMEHYLRYKTNTEIHEIVVPRSETLLIRNLLPNTNYVFSIYPVIAVNYTLITGMIEKEIKTLHTYSREKKDDVLVLTESTTTMATDKTNDIINNNKNVNMNLIIICSVSLVVLIIFVTGSIVIIKSCRLNEDTGHYVNEKRRTPTKKNDGENNKRKKRRRPQLEEPESGSSSTASDSSDSERTYSEIIEDPNYNDVN